MRSENPEARRASLISLCEGKLQQALQSEKPRSLISIIRENGCTALRNPECARCRICPSEPAWDRVAGYYKVSTPIPHHPKHGVPPYEVDAISPHPTATHLTPEWGGAG